MPRESLRAEAARRGITMFAVRNERESWSPGPYDNLVTGEPVTSAHLPWLTGNVAVYVARR
jgi:hypothetical protein